MKARSLVGGIAAQFSTKSLVLIPIAVGINLIGGTLSSTLKLPLFLDMIGTTVIACLSGPWVAALCGLLTNIFLSLVANPVYLPYALSSVLCGLVVGYMVKAGCFKKIWGVVLVWLACAVVNTVTASFVTVFVYGGATGVNGTSVMTAALVVAMKNIAISVVSSSMAENLLDKGITMAIAYVIVRRIPKRFLSQYALDGPEDDEALDDIDDDDSMDGPFEADADPSQTVGDQARGVGTEAYQDPKKTSGVESGESSKPESTSIIIPDSPLARMHPLAKIAGVCSLGLSTIIWPDFTLGLVLILALFLVAGAVRMLRSFAKIMLGFGIPVTVMLLFIQGCYSPRNTVTILDFGFARMGLQGSLYAAKIVVTLMVFLGSFYLTTKTTYMGCLVAALTQVGVPSKIGYLILASLNVVPQMQRRISVVEQSQHARGLETGGGIVSRMKAFIPLLGPVVLSSLTDSQERGMTLETRGFGIRGVRRTSYIAVRWNRRDKLATWLSVLFFLAVLLTAVLSRAGLVPLGVLWGGRI